MLCINIKDNIYFDGQYFTLVKYARFSVKMVLNLKQKLKKILKKIFYTIQCTKKIYFKKLISVYDPINICDI